MELPGETVQMEKLVSVEGENTLRRIGAGPFWEVCLFWFDVVPCPFASCSLLGWPQQRRLGGA